MKTQGMQESEDRLEEHLKTIAPKPEGEAGTPPAPAEVVPTESQGGPPAAETPPAGEVPPAAAETPPAETPPAEGASVFDVGAFNERFGSDFVDEDTLKSSLNRLSDLKEFDTVRTEREKLQGEMTELQAKYTEAQELLDPRKHFVNEEEYRRQIILQKHGAELNPALINKIVSADFDSMDDVDVLILGKLVANPDIRGGDAGARELVYRQLGVDPDQDRSEWDQYTQNIVLEAARNQRRELAKIKDIEVPEKADFEAQRAEREQTATQAKEQLKGSWGEVAKEMVDNFNTLDLSRKGEGDKQEVYFSYEIDSEFKEAATGLVVDYLVDNNMEPSKENVREAEQYVQDLFVRKNMNAIVQAYGRDVEAKLIEKHNLEIDNPKPPSEAEAPQGDLDANLQELHDYVKEDLGQTRQAGDKLFG